MKYKLGEKVKILKKTAPGYEWTEGQLIREYGKKLTGYYGGLDDGFYMVSKEKETALERSGNYFLKSDITKLVETRGRKKKQAPIANAPKRYGYWAIEKVENGYLVKNAQMSVVYNSKEDMWKDLDRRTE